LERSNFERSQVLLKGDAAIELGLRISVNGLEKCVAEVNKAALPGNRPQNRPIIGAYNSEGK
jgi:hypothetical protein